MFRWDVSETRCTFGWCNGGNPCLAPTIGDFSGSGPSQASSALHQLQGTLVSLFQPPLASSVSVIRCRRPSSQPRPLDRQPYSSTMHRSSTAFPNSFSDGSNGGKAHGVAVCHRFNGSLSLNSSEKSCARWHCQMSMFPSLVMPSSEALNVLSQGFSPLWHDLPSTGVASLKVCRRSVTRSAKNSLHAPK